MIIEVLITIYALLGSATASVCTSGTNSSTWPFTDLPGKSYSCASSNGGVNDLDSFPTSCKNDPSSVRIQLTPGKAECLVANSDCKIPMHDFVSLDYDFHISGCEGAWAAPLWMTPDVWQWGPGSGEVDSLEFCPRDGVHLNFAGGGHQVSSSFSINKSEGHVTVRKDEEGIMTIVACAAGKLQCDPPVYQDCSDCLKSANTYGCWCNAQTNPPNIYGSGGCKNGGDCMWTLVSDIWNGVSGDAGYEGCMTAVPAIGLEKGKPNLKSSCAFSVEKITVRGGGPNGSLKWGAGSPASCSVLTPEARI